MWAVGDGWGEDVGDEDEDEDATLRMGFLVGVLG